jgi:hypothetical protein
MELLEWIIWAMILGLTIALFVLWLRDMKGVGRGQSRDGIAMAIVCTAPRLIITWSVILISFLFIDLNKLHLLWICPLTFLLVVNLRVIMKIKNVSETSKDGEA